MTRSMTKLFLLSLSIMMIIGCAGGRMTSQPLDPNDPANLTLKRIYTDREFSPARFGPVRWLADGSGYTTLEDSKTHPGSLDAVRYNPVSGSSDIILAAEQLIPDGSDTPLTITGYDWSDQGDKILVFTNAQRVWRYRTKGDYWVLTLSTGALHQVGKGLPEASLKFAKFSPDGQSVAYVSENNIYVEALPGGKISQITHDGSKDIINGTTDWAYEEEFGLRDAFRWSPDGQSIAYWQIDASGVPEFSLINYTDSLYPTIKTFQYPKVGQTNPSARIGVIPATGGETVWMKVPGNPRENYLPRMEWSGRTNEIYFQHMNRRQNTNTLYLGNRETGDVRKILVETDEAWLEIVEDLQWFDDGSYFSWVSERDGWRHVYMVSRDGSKVDLVTPGEYDVISVLSIDDVGGWIYYIASPDNATQRYLYRQRTDGSEPTRLTPADQPGTHRYQISADEKWAIHTYSTFNKPALIELVSLPDHQSIRLFVDNHVLASKLKSLNLGEYEFFQVPTDGGVQLDGFMIRPPNFNPSKKYPVVFFVYGEPAGARVRDMFPTRAYFWHNMLAQMGYIVMSVDNRGTPSPKGRAFNKAIYRQVGPLNAYDQSKALKVILERYTYVDGDRVGMWGWSGGGTTTLNAMFRYPELYHVGMSVAPVPDIRLYDSIYQERYSGVLPDDAASYDEASTINHAAGLQGKLLLIHGTGDDNVHYQGTARLINKLIELNKPFTSMLYPNRSHGIYEGAGTTRHVYELLTRYLTENLPLN